MEDEKGLDLSLGLPCGGNTSANKAKCSTSSDARSTEDDRGNKLINEFKNFLEGGNHHSLKIGDNCYQQLAKNDHHSETPNNIEEFTRPVASGEKRKSLYFMADEGSTAENEDIADSEKDGFGESDSTDILRQKKIAVSSENDLNSTDQPTILPSYPIIQGSGANFPLMFGYASAQIPTLDNSSFLGRNLVNQNNSATTAPVAGSNQHDNIISENARDNVNQLQQHIGEEGTTSEEAIIPSEFVEAIKPGMAAELKFGGNGSYPNLPWVSTTGSGPNGKTISGVTYRFSNSEIKVVCACHGFHMSPQDFVVHASEETNGAPLV